MKGTDRTENNSLSAVLSNRALYTITSIHGRITVLLRAWCAGELYRCAAELRRSSAKSTLDLANVGAGTRISGSLVPAEWFCACRGDVDYKVHSWAEAALNILSVER